MPEGELSIMPDCGFFKLCSTMLKISTDYAKTMPGNFSKRYIREEIILDSSRKGQHMP